MDSLTYMQKSARSVSSIDNRSSIPVALAHAIDGVVTEAGECQDALKKVAYYGAELDTVNLAEEIGDLMWYIMLAVRTLASMQNIPAEKLWEDTLQKNIDKLKARYPEEFTTENAINRDTDSEREILEA